jgi:hypothetical protein
LRVGREVNNPTRKKILLRKLKRRPRPTQGCRADDDDDDDDDEDENPETSVLYYIQQTYK